MSRVKFLNIMFFIFILPIFLYSQDYKINSKWTRKTYEGTLSPYIFCTEKIGNKIFAGGGVDSWSPSFLVTETNDINWKLLFSDSNQITKYGIWQDNPYIRKMKCVSDNEILTFSRNNKRPFFNYIGVYNISKNTFNKNFFGSDTLYPVLDVDFINSNSVIACSYKDFYISNDGFKTFANKKFKLADSGFYASSLKYFNDGTVYLKAVDDSLNSYFIKSDTSFNEFFISGICNQSNANFHFISKKVGFVNFYKNINDKSYEIYILRTSDGGENWNTVFKDTSNDLRNLSTIKFSNFDEQNMIAFGQVNILIISTDGGLIWENQYNKNNSGLFSRNEHYSVSYGNSAKNIFVFSWLLGYYVYDDGTDVNEITDGSIVSPNPARDYIEIQNIILSETKNSELDIYNITGEKIHTSSSLRNATPKNGNLRIDISQLIPGVYFIKIGNKYEKFIKE